MAQLTIKGVQTANRVMANKLIEKDKTINKLLDEIDRLRLQRDVFKGATALLNDLRQVAIKVDKDPSSEENLVAMNNALRDLDECKMFQVEKTQIEKLQSDIKELQGCLEAIIKESDPPSITAIASRGLAATRRTSE